MLRTTDLALALRLVQAAQTLGQPCDVHEESPGLWLLDLRSEEVAGALLSLLQWPPAGHALVGRRLSWYDVQEEMDNLLRAAA